MKDLLNAGLLRVGEVLECEPRQGEVYKATLSEDASISYEGMSLDSPSIWASYVAQNEMAGEMLELEVGVWPNSALSLATR